ncbi:hypothetical protein DL771_008121 [Monosporascus sp. 5C6A]|nr:hypothetical protein DL771_008121 [Monosporascus sp. 5C6A]
MAELSQPHAQYDTQNEVMWFICVQKEPSWDQDRFQHEYQTVHANLTRVGHQHSGLPLNYVQFGAMDLPDPSNPGGDTGDGPWDFITGLHWPSTSVIWKSFQNPAYRETAGKHIFCRLDQKGVLAKRVGALGVVTERFVEHGNFVIHVFHRRGAEGDEVSAAWVEGRVKIVEGWTKRGGGPVRQYSVWKDITPEDTGAFFKDTQFTGGSWRLFTAVERDIGYIRRERT